MEFPDTENGITIHVRQTHWGYSVLLHDDDANEWLPASVAYPTEAEAIERAKRIAEGKP